MKDGSKQIGWEVFFISLIAFIASMVFIDILGYLSIIIMIVALIFGILGMIGGFLQSNENNREIKRDITNRLAKDVFKDFEIGDKLSISGYCIYISKDHKRLGIKYDGGARVETPILINLNNLIKCQLIQNDVVIKENGIGRAIVGGVLAGGVGAIVGASTAKSKTEIEKLEIRLSTTEISNPLIRLPIYTRVGKSSTNVDNTISNTINKAEELLAVLELLIEENKKQ